MIIKFQNALDFNVEVHDKYCVWLDLLLFELFFLFFLRQ